MSDRLFRPGRGFWPLLCCALSIAVAEPAAARIKLITLPVRERTEIQLEHATATLVEEERVVPLVQGVNQVDFSWSNTQINPNTIVFRVIGSAGDSDLDVKVLSVSYPPNEAALIWNVSASESGSARVRISYLIGNLSKSFSYRAVASHDEKELTLREYMQVKNLSNEQFGDAGVWAGFGERILKPIGLNETKEVLIAKYENVPVRKVYTSDPREYGYSDRTRNQLRIPMHYVLKNDEESSLGENPLQDGKVRIFIKGPENQEPAVTTFLGEDWAKFTPRDEELRLYLGAAQDIVVKRTIDKNEVRRIAGSLYDREVVIKYEIENFKDEEVVLDIAESLRHIRSELQGENDRAVEWNLGEATTFEGKPDPEHTTADRLLFHVTLPKAKGDQPAEKIVHKLHLTLKNEW